MMIDELTGAEVTHTPAYAMAGEHWSTPPPEHNPPGTGVEPLLSVTEIQQNLASQSALAADSENRSVLYAWFGLIAVLLLLHGISWRFQR